MEGERRGGGQGGEGDGKGGIYILSLVDNTGQVVRYSRREI